MRAVSLTEDERAHERVPTTGLMAVVNACFDQRLDRNFLFFECFAQFALEATFYRRFGRCSDCCGSGRIGCGLGGRCFGHGFLLLRLGLRSEPSYPRPE